jgi:hypothetical protein
MLSMLRDEGDYPSVPGQILPLDAFHSNILAGLWITDIDGAATCLVPIGAHGGGLASPSAHVETYSSKRADSHDPESDRTRICKIEGSGLSLKST